MIEIDRSYRHPRTGLEVRVLRNDAEVYEMEVRLPPGLSGAQAHVHLDLEQSFTVLEGEGVISVDGSDRTLRAGEALEIARGRKHADIDNLSSEDLVYRDRLSPSPPFVRAYAETVIAMLEDGRLADEGELSPLHMAVVQHATGGESWLTGVPVTLQRALLPALAAIGRRRGHKIESPQRR